jgi:hypothetical protein
MVSTLGMKTPPKVPNFRVAAAELLDGFAMRAKVEGATAP